MTALCSTALLSSVLGRQAAQNDDLALPLARVAGEWVGTDSATGTTQYRIEIDRTGSGYIGLAAPRFPVMVWRVNSVTMLDGKLQLTLSRATTNTQSRSATLFSTNCWATRVLEMQMRVTDGEEKEIMPLTAERILLRDVRELRELDERIRRIAANAALLK